MNEPDHLDDAFEFAEEDDEVAVDEADASAWRIVLVDDEPNVHKVTKLALEDLKVDGRRVEIISAYSEQEGRALFETQKDIALAIIDVIMETEQSGLDLVDYIRNVLRLQNTRLILRTGQPGQAPEREIVQRYDINDYKSKTELTSSRLFTTVVASLRSYRDLIELQRHSLELTKINLMSQSLYQLNRVDAFAYTMVDKLHETFNFSKHVFVFERRKASPGRSHVIVQNLPSLPPVPPLIEETTLFEALPSLETFLNEDEATASTSDLLFTRLRSVERELIFIHGYDNKIGELSDKSLSLLTQQLDTAYSNTTLYDDHLELNLAMERFVPDATLRHLDQQSISSVEVGHRTSIISSTLSLDIRGFTTLCENLSSNESFQLVNALLTLLGPVIERHHGNILKFVGDGIIAMFAREDYHVQDAIDCGVALSDTIRDFNRNTELRNSISKELSEPIRVGIGIHSGRIHLGAVGASSRIDVSVRGFSVTMAEMLQTLTKPFGITMLVDASCVKSTEDASSLRYLGASDTLNGQTHKLYQVVAAESQTLRQDITTALEAFSEARRKFERGDLSEARTDFEKLYRSHPDDPVLGHFLTRVQRAQQNRRDT